jgi:predicted 3-demethylubiquinone-9 3-methyltransferase (glyoxalase superfamily)
MQKITPFLLMDGRAEEAMNFYTSVFKNSKIVNVSRAGDNGPVFSATLELDGERFILLNPGPKVQFNEAVSFFINCETQAEVDELWDKLLAGGGTPSQCGWLKDKFGVSWQIIPPGLGEALTDPDPEKAARAMKAMLGMKRLDIEALRNA